MDKPILNSRRSSILKPSKPQLPSTAEDDDNDETRTNRKVRFSSNFVKPFATASDNNTIWDSTYEEAIEKSSTLSNIQYTSNSIHLANCTNDINQTHTQEAESIERTNRKTISVGDNTTRPNAFSNIRFKTPVTQKVQSLFCPQDNSNLENLPNTQQDKVALNQRRTILFGHSIGNDMDITQAVNPYTKFEQNDIINNDSSMCDLRKKANENRKIINFQVYLDDTDMDVTNAAGDVEGNQNANVVQHEVASNRKTQVFNVDSNDAAMDETTINSNGIFETDANLNSDTNRRRKTQVFDANSKDADMDETSIATRDEYTDAKRKTQVFDVHSEAAAMDETAGFASVSIKRTTQYSYSERKTVIDEIVINPSNLSLSKSQESTQVFNVNSEDADMENSNDISRCVPGICTGSDLMRKTLFFEDNSLEAAMNETGFDRNRKTQVFNINSEDADLDFTSAIPGNILQSASLMVGATRPDSKRRTQVFDVNSDDAAMDETSYVPKDAWQASSNTDAIIPLQSNGNRKTQVFNMNSEAADLDFTTAVSNRTMHQSTKAFTDSKRKTHIFDVNSEDAAMEETINAALHNDLAKTAVIMAEKPFLVDGKTELFNLNADDANMEFTAAISTNILQTASSLGEERLGSKRITQIFDVNSEGAAMEETVFVSNEMLKAVGKMSKSFLDVNRKTQVFNVNSEDADLDYTSPISTNILEPASYEDAGARAAAKRKTQIFNANSEDAAMEETVFISHELLQAASKMSKSSSEVNRKTILFNTNSDDAYLDYTSEVTTNILEPASSGDAVTRPDSKKKIQIFDVNSDDAAMEQTLLISNEMLKSAGKLSTEVNRKTMLFNTNSDDADLDYTSAVTTNILQTGTSGGAVVRPDSKRKTQIFDANSEDAAMEETAFISKELLKSTGNMSSKVNRKTLVFNANSDDADLDYTTAVTSTILESASRAAVARPDSKRKTQIFDANSEEAAMEETVFISNELLKTTGKMSKNSSELNRKTLLFNANSENANLDYTSAVITNTLKAAPSGGVLARPDSNRKTQIFDINSENAAMEETAFISKEIRKTSEVNRKTLVFNANSDDADLDYTSAVTTNILVPDPSGGAVPRHASKRKTQIFDTNSNDSAMDETAFIKQQVFNTTAEDANMNFSKAISKNIVQSVSSMGPNSISIFTRKSEHVDTDSLHTSIQRGITTLNPKQNIQIEPGNEEILHNIQEDKTPFKNEVVQNKTGMIHWLSDLDEMDCSNAKETANRNSSFQLIKNISQQKTIYFNTPKHNDDLEMTKVVANNGVQTINKEEGHKSVDIVSRNAEFSEPVANTGVIFEVSTSENACENRRQAEGDSKMEISGIGCPAGQSRYKDSKQGRNSTYIFQDTVITDFFCDFEEKETTNPREKKNSVARKHTNHQRTIFFGRETNNELEMSNTANQVDAEDNQERPVQKMSESKRSLVETKTNSSVSNESPMSPIPNKDLLVEIKCTPQMAKEHVLAVNVADNSLGTSFAMDMDVDKSPSPMATRETSVSTEVPNTIIITDIFQAIRESTKKIASTSKRRSLLFEQYKSPDNMKDMHILMNESPAIIDVHSAMDTIMNESPAIKDLTINSPNSPSTSYRHDEEEHKIKVLTNPLPSILINDEQPSEMMITPNRQVLRTKQKRYQSPYSHEKNPPKRANKTDSLVPSQLIPKSIRNEFTLTPTAFNLCETGIEFIKSDNEDDVQAVEDVEVLPTNPPSSRKCLPRKGKVFKVDKIEFHLEKATLINMDKHNLPPVRTSDELEMAHKIDQQEQLKLDNEIQLYEEQLLKVVSVLNDTYNQLLAEFEACSHVQPDVVSDSLLDKISKKAKGQSVYKIKKLEEHSVEVYVIIGKYNLNVEFLAHSGDVQSIGMDFHIDEVSDSTAFQRYISKFMTCKMDAAVLKSSIGNGFSIMSLLDYLEYQLIELSTIFKSIYYSMTSYNANFDNEQRLNYYYLSPRVEVEVLIDLSEMNMNAVKITTAIRDGPASRNKINEIFLQTPRSAKFPYNFTTALNTYLKSIDPVPYS